MLAHLDPATRAIVILLAIAAVYALSGFIWPYTACPACHGGGKFASPGGKNWRACGRCSGSGRRVRLISRLLGRGK